MALRSKKFDDVRMRGFAERTDVDVLWDLIDARVGRIAGELAPLHDAAGHVLADEVRSPVNVPGFHRSAMDGFALAAAKTPGIFEIVGEVFPGRPLAAAIAPSQAAAIMTGAPLPAGCDCVVPVEQVEIDGARVSVPQSFAPGKNVGRCGEDVTEGEKVLSAGRVLRPQDLGLLASIGAARFHVVRTPRVAIFATGNELLPCGSQPNGYQIVDSNSIMLAALMKRDGAEVVKMTLLGDRPDVIRAVANRHRQRAARAT